MGEIPERRHLAGTELPAKHSRLGGTWTLFVLGEHFAGRLDQVVEASAAGDPPGAEVRGEGGEGTAGASTTGREKG